MIRSIFHPVKMLAVAVVFCACAVCVAPGEGRTAGEDEREAIAAVIDIYIDGGRKGSGKVMKAAFVDGANIYSARMGGPIQLLYDLVDKHPAANTIPYTISKLDIADDIAMARVEIDNWGGAKYTDMFTLIKTDKGWKIASKVSHTH